MVLVPAVKAARVGGEEEHPNPVWNSMQCGKQVKRDEGGTASPRVNSML
ncbi:unnamed protein product [Tetraodon nigroviridis]|uniref:(spotted green pufferfish) hypothetical protein n=1 Tax=Tetraodon nigroviridis TaxID=99883 RepID=Q4RAN6_TETNG|nr:unnamed protein product [Tetraodon nigroviridis]